MSVGTWEGACEGNNVGALVGCFVGNNEGSYEKNLLHLTDMVSQNFDKKSIICT